MISTLLAQAADVIPGPTALYTYGPMGIVLGWFMWRAEKIFSKISDLGHRIDGLTKAMLMDLISRDNIGPHTKQLAREALAKIEARDER